jgi:hypothetical protein
LKRGELDETGQPSAGPGGAIETLAPQFRGVIGHQRPGAAHLDGRSIAATREIELDPGGRVAVDRRALRKREPLAHETARNDSKRPFGKSSCQTVVDLQSCAGREQHPAQLRGEIVVEPPARQQPLR